MKKNIYLIHGEERFLVQEKVNSLLKSHPNKEQEKFVEQFELNRLFQAVSSVSLFASSKIFILKNPFFLFESITDAEIEKIKQILDLIPKNNYVMIIYALGKKLDMRKKINNFLKKQAQTTEYAPFKDWDQKKVIAWISNYLKTKGKKFEARVPEYLEEFNGNNLTQITTEIEKLITYIGNKNIITFQDVKNLSTNSKITIFDLSQAVHKREIKNILSYTHSLLNDGEDSYKLFGLVVSNLRLYSQILDLVASNNNLLQISKILNKNPYYMKQIFPHIKQHYTIPIVKKAYQVFQQKDLEIKSGKIKPKNALMIALLSLA